MSSRKLGILLVVAGAVLALDSSTASAQYPLRRNNVYFDGSNWHMSYHYPPYSVQRSYPRGRMYNPPRVYRGYATRPWYHDTSHWDYHSPQWVPHGNHYDLIPGHYHLHRTGHWHR